MISRRREGFFERSCSKTDSGCWIWNGYIGPKGYGELIFEGKHARAHRVAYQIRYGTIVRGEHLHHTCCVKSCVNPDHLQLLGPAQHMKIHSKRKTHCKRGHELAGENLIVYRRSYRDDQHICRICNQLRQQWRKVQEKI